MNATKEGLSYNTSRSEIKLKEYGRNLENMINWMKQEEDKEKRTRLAYTLVEMMKQINPVMKESEEYNQKVWDDLFIMAGFELDIDSPYPAPQKEMIGRRPQRLGYVNNRIKIRHYGKNIEHLIESASNLEDPEERVAAVASIGRLMKSFHYIWNKDAIDDEVVLNNIISLSQGRLRQSVEKMKEAGLPQPQQHRRGSNNRYGGRKNYSNKRRKG